MGSDGSAYWICAVLIVVNAYFVLNDLQALIDRLKKYKPSRTRLRLANCFEMKDSEGLCYFPKAKNFKIVDKVTNFFTSLTC